VLLVGLLFAGLVAVYGCKKSQPAAAPNSMAGMKPNSVAKDVASAAIEQTTCPVTGEPIDKNIFVEYKGKKVYFCCADCKGLFEKEPEKYAAKLPQFAK
jgi:YHS domain-containing protein